MATTRPHAAALTLAFLLMFLLIFAVASVVGNLTAQSRGPIPQLNAEKPLPPYEAVWWPMFTIDARWDQNYFYGRLRVDVVNTPGACIYLFRTAREGNDPVAVSVPKRELPAGRGCQ